MTLNVREGFKSIVFLCAVYHEKVFLKEKNVPKLRHPSRVSDKTKKSASFSSVFSTQIRSIQCGEQAHMPGLVEERSNQ